MSTTPPPAPPGTPSGYPPPGTTGTKDTESKLISHSNLFYWWPVWFLAFLMSAWTAVENNRLAVVPAGTQVTKQGERTFVLEVPDNRQPSDSLVKAAGTSAYNRESNQSVPPF